MTKTASATNIRKPPYFELKDDLRSFHHFTDWVFRRFDSEARALGIANHVLLTFYQVLTPPKSDRYFDSLCTFTVYPTNDIKLATELAVLESVIIHLGWLSWDEYLRLVYVHVLGDGAEGVSHFEYVRERGWDDHLDYLDEILQQKNMRSVAMVLRKVIERYQWEDLMFKKYRDAFRVKFRAYREFRGTLSFTEKDLQEETERLKASGAGSSELNVKNVPEHKPNKTKPRKVRTRKIPRRRAFHA